MSLTIKALETFFIFGGYAYLFVFTVSLIIILLMMIGFVVLVIKERSGRKRSTK